MTHLRTFDPPEFDEYGIELTAAECPVCEHTTAAGDTCPQCQPTPDVKRCKACYRRGAIVVHEPNGPPATR